MQLHIHGRFLQVQLSPGSSTGTSVKVNYGNSFTSTGTITVRANGTCGSSPVSSLVVSPAPATPGSISGNSSCLQIQYECYI
ncbi:MAG: hypothetical protein IPN61_02025 [Bacteroidetes bacterium]|nr:hypothetical protein [Bacteroidota bacterium]